MSMPELKIKIGGDTTGFQVAMAKVNNIAQTGSRNIARSMGAAFAGTVGAGALIGATKSIIEFGGHIDDLAKKSDVSREALQEWGYAAKQNGGDINTVAAAFKGLSKARLEAMANPTGETAKMFGMMGIGAGEIKGGDPNALMTKIGKGFQGGNFGGLEEGMVSKLLGRGGVDMLATFNEDFQATILEARNLGAILKDDVIGNLDKIGDAADRISAAFKGPIATAVVFVSRTIEALMNQMGAMFRSLGHLSTLSPKDLMSAQGRTNANNALKEAVKAMQETSPMKVFNDIFNPKAEEAKKNTKQKADTSILEKNTEAVKQSVAKDKFDPLNINPDAAAKMGMFIGGNGPGGSSVNDILGKQQLTAQQQIVKNTQQALSVLNRIAAKGGETWGAP